MFRALVQVAKQVPRAPVFRAQPVRCFAADVLEIPTDKEQQWGRRKEELDAGKYTTYLRDSAA